MNDGPDIRGELKKRLDPISGSSAIPRGTLVKANRRRSKVMAAGGLGIVALVAAVFVGAQLIDPSQSRLDVAPVTTPTLAEPTPQEGVTRDKHAPPPVTVRSTDRSVELTAWSYCFGDRCIAGGPPQQPPRVGSPDEVFVEFPLDNWSFDAFFTPAGEECGRTQQVSVGDTDDGALVLRPAGYAGIYDVTLFGRGESDLSVTFRWTTPEDGPLPEPEARTAILGGSARNPTSYGIELAIDNLAETPEQASATITVKAANGETLTFDAELARSRCRPEGSLYWDGPDDMGRRATELGDGPFRYKVVLLLDGKRYVAKATWPEDEIRGNEPSVALDFSPALPRLR